MLFAGFVSLRHKWYFPFYLLQLVEGPLSTVSLSGAYYGPWKGEWRLATGACRLGVGSPRYAVPGTVCERRWVPPGHFEVGWSRAGRFPFSAVDLRLECGWVGTASLAFVCHIARAAVERGVC